MPGADEPDLLQLFVHPLNQIGVRYLVSGSVAAMLYGEPRLTHDVDLVVFLQSQQLDRLSEIYPSPEFYVPRVEQIAIEMARENRGHFNIIHADSGLKADFYLAGRDDFHAWAFRKARPYSMRGETINLAPPEYVIVRKLEYYREGGSEKHLRDIRSMLAVSGQTFDNDALGGWIERQGVQAEWKKINI